MPDRPMPPVGGPRREWFRVENAASSDRAVVRIYDAIGGWFGVWASELVEQLDAITAPVIELRVNSPGGDVFEGLAIMNSLRAHPARVIAYVDGMAASAASYIVVGGADEVVMGLGTELMIHNPSAMTWGDADLHRDSADRLDAIRDNLATVYHGKAGGELADWVAAMAAETWYSAAEAVAAGLADRVDNDVRVDDSATNRFNLSVFNYAGRAQAPAPQTPDAAPAAGSITTQEGSRTVAFTDEQLTTMRQQLGLAEDADEATIVAGLQEALAEQAEPTPPTTAALPPGTVAVDQATLDELRASAALGRAAHDTQQRDRRERLVDAAVADGRIAPARRDHWVAQLAADPGSEDTLASLAKGLIPLEAIGHSGNDANNDTEADALYASVFGKEG